MNKPTLEELKEYVFGKGSRFLCHTSYCGCKDGYCPRYDCGCLDKLKTYTDKQWRNAMSYVDAYYKAIVFDICDYAFEVVDYLWHRKGGKNND